MNPRTVSRTDGWPERVAVDAGRQDAISRGTQTVSVVDQTLRANTAQAAARVEALTTDFERAQAASAPESNSEPAKPKPAAVSFTTVNLDRDVLYRHSAWHGDFDPVYLGRPPDELWGT